MVVVYSFSCYKYLVKDCVKLFHKQCEDDTGYMCHLVKGGTFFMHNSCCFIGHRTIEKSERLILALKKTIVMLLDNGVDTFLFGSKSAFNDLALELVDRLKQDYPFVKRIYVRSAYPCIDESYENYLLKRYDQTYFPDKIEKAGRFAYVERNCEMIDNSDYCIFYYNENYVPQSKKPNKNKMLIPAKQKSGTRVAYLYAAKKKKQIINVYDIVK